MYIDYRLIIRVFCYCNSHRLSLCAILRSWCIKHVCKIRKNGTARYARMEFTDRVTLTHCDRSLFDPRALRTEEVRNFRRIIRACYRCHVEIRAHMREKGRKCDTEVNSLRRTLVGSEKRSLICTVERKNSQSQAASKSPWCLKGDEVVDSPNRFAPYKTHRSAEVKSRQWLMVEETSSAYISLDSTPSADTPPPGMLRRSSFDLLQIEPPFFLCSPGCKVGKHREAADGIDPFARGIRTSGNRGRDEDTASAH